MNMFHKYNAWFFIQGNPRTVPPKYIKTEHVMGYSEYCILIGAMKICVSVRSP